MSDNDSTTCKAGDICVNKEDVEAGDIRVNKEDVDVENANNEICRLVDSIFENRPASDFVPVITTKCLLLSCNMEKKMRPPANMHLLGKETLRDYYVSLLITHSDKAWCEEEDDEEDC